MLFYIGRDSTNRIIILVFKIHNNLVTFRLSFMNYKTFTKSWSYSLYSHRIFLRVIQLFDHGESGTTGSISKAYPP